MRQSSGGAGGSLSAQGFSHGSKGSILLKSAGKREDHLGLPKGLSMVKSTTPGISSAINSIKMSGAAAA